MKQSLLVLWPFALLGAVMTLYEWYAVRSGHFYHPMAAVFGPFAVIVFGLAGLFPSLIGKAGPEEKRKKTVQGIVLIIGLVVGLLNWYAMTHF